LLKQKYPFGDEIRRFVFQSESLMRVNFFKASTKPNQRHFWGRFEIWGGVKFAKFLLLLLMPRKLKETNF